jgi:hypothetical protein
MLIVEMVRGEPGEAGFATFDLQVKTWRKLLEVAEKFGWTPEGTVVDKDSAKRNHDYIAHFQPTYQVEPWGYCKRVTDMDATNSVNTALGGMFVPVVGLPQEDSVR